MPPKLLSDKKGDVRWFFEGFQSLELWYLSHHAGLHHEAGYTRAEDLDQHFPKGADWRLKILKERWDDVFFDIPLGIPFWGRLSSRWLPGFLGWQYKVHLLWTPVVTPRPSAKSGPSMSRQHNVWNWGISCRTWKMQRAQNMEKHGKMLRWRCRLEMIRRKTAKHFKVSSFHKASNSLEDIGDKLQLKFKHVRDAFKPLNLQRHWFCGMTMVETPLHRVHLQGLQTFGLWKI